MRVRFDSFVVDSDARRLLRDGQEIHLSPKAFDLLCRLIVDRPNVIAKETLMETLWADTYVGEGGLTVLVGEARRALGDDARNPRFIRTVHSRGYAFVGTAIDEAATARSRPASGYWLSIKDKDTILLQEGENFIGRLHGCQVWINGKGISRRHARIVVDSANARITLYDHGSTNGTWVRNERITGPVDLAHGDVITLGVVQLTLVAGKQDAEEPTKRRTPKRGSSA